MMKVIYGEDIIEAYHKTEKLLILKEWISYFVTEE